MQKCFVICFWISRNGWLRIRRNKRITRSRSVPLVFNSNAVTVGCHSISAMIDNWKFTNKSSSYVCDVLGTMISTHRCCYRFPSMNMVGVVWCNQIREWEVGDEDCNGSNKCNMSCGRTFSREILSYFPFPQTVGAVKQCKLVSLYLARGRYVT